MQLSVLSILFLHLFFCSKLSFGERDYFIQGTLKLHFRTQSTEYGILSVPWVSSSSVPRISPICHDEVSNKIDNGARLAHVVCRHAGFMVATKWFEVFDESSFFNSTGVSVYCRGDEQFVDHCQMLQTHSSPCKHFLALECGGTDYEPLITLDSPGYPIYIPMVVCEWNITLPYGRNLLIQFEQFELPSPVYDETMNAISCRSGYLDVMSWHEDISRMILDGRFCGRYSPGNLTILSNRILIRFTAGSFKIDEISKKGLSAKCSVVPQAYLSAPQMMVHWALIGSALILSAIIAICLWIWKRNLYQYSQRFCYHCCWTNSALVSSQSQNENFPTSSISGILPQTSRNDRVSGFEEGNNLRFESSNGRSEAEFKFSSHSCDSRHWEQTHRLEKLRSADRKCIPSDSLVTNSAKVVCFNKGFLNSSTAKATNDDKEESHIYEDIDIGVQCGYKQSFGFPGGFSFSQSSPTSTETVQRIPPLFCHSLSNYEPVSLTSHQAIICGEKKISPSTSASSAEIASFHRPSLNIRHLISSSVHRRSPSSSPSYFPTSSDSASSSAIYVNPEPDSTCNE